MTSANLETMEYAERWRAMILQAENPQGLDWIKRTCDRKGHMTPELKALIAQREQEINEGRYATGF